MLLPELPPDHLIVLTFGPGVGELVLLRVPPDDWMVIDGCGVDKTEYAVAALAHYQARARLVEDPGGGWSHSLVLDPELGDHDLLKVPHHGSNEALHDDVLKLKARVPDPLRVIAPYSKQRLPRFVEGMGAN